MNEDFRILFHELAGQPTAYREDHYARQHVPDAVRADLESLLRFDQTRASSPITERVREATERFLLSDAPVAEDGRCGPYRLNKLLGRGGMGSVYLAERADGEVEQRVAVKFLHAGADMPSLRERFLRERQILASLNHPGIARLLDAGHSDGHPYLAMEYVDGTRIDQYTADLEPREVLSLFIQVAEAVSYAHRNLIIHRDLKPSNILVEAGRPKLLDFGIAKLLDAPEETRTLDRVLTPEYASPEQLIGDTQATTSDVYSLGAVLYRLLTKRSPRPPVAPPNELPKDLAAIVNKAMRAEPEERYASVDLFIADLRAYLEHKPVAARRGNAFYLARKFMRRRWLPVAAGTLAIAGVVCGLLVANEERVIAARRFDQVRQLSKRLLDLDDEIRNLPGSTKARNRIVSASLDYLGRLRAEARPSRWGLRARKDLDLALEISTAYLQVARVQGVPTNLNLGQFDEARKSLIKADELVESVLAVRSFPKYREALLASADINRDAMILAQSGDFRDDALKFGRKTGVRLDALLQSPDVTKTEMVAAARMYSNLALTNSNMHYLEEATVYARRAVELARTNQDQRQLGRALGVLANTSRFAGDLDGALRAIRESRSIAAKLADPDNAESMFHYSAAYWREGLILGELNNINLNRPREAAPLLEKAFDIAETLARKDPHDYTSRSYVSMAGRELGDVLRETDPERALAVYDHTLRRLREIKDNHKARRDELWPLSGSAYALRRLHRPDEARQRLEAALAILRELKLYPAASVEIGEECDATLRALADHYNETGRNAAAIRTYEELHDKIQASKPQPWTDLRHANNLSRLYRDLASLHAGAGHSAQAVALSQSRLDLWRYWDQKLPNNGFVRQQLAAAAQQ